MMNKLIQLSMGVIFTVASVATYSTPEKQDKEFWKLIEEYSLAKTPSQKHAMEKQIDSRYSVTKTVVMIDTSGFTLRTIEEGILSPLVVINKMRTLISDVISKAPGGNIVKFDADNAMLIFDTPDQALKTLRIIYKALRESSINQDSKFKIKLSSGVAYGPILLLSNDAFSEKLNIASKLGEDTAGADEILFTEEAYALLTPPVKAEKKNVRVSNVDIVYYKILPVLEPDQSPPNQK